MGNPCKNITKPRNQHIRRGKLRNSTFWARNKYDRLMPDSRKPCG